MLQRTLPAGFIAPCLPSKTDKLPSGSDWLHEIKHDGFRVIARKNAAQVKLYSRPGNDLTYASRWSSRRWHACVRARAQHFDQVRP
jgi:ATP-dependent DNA ligase